MFLVDQAVGSIAIHMRVSKAKHRIWPLRRVYSKASIEARYRDVINTKHYKYLSRFLETLRSFYLNGRKLDIMTSVKNENFRKKHFDRYAGKVVFHNKRSDFE